MFERVPPFGAALVQLGTERELAHPRRSGFFVNQRFDRFAPFAADLVEFGLHRAERIRLLGRTQVRARSGLVQHVDRLVGKVAVGDVASGERHAGAQGLVGVAHLVVPFVAGSDVAQNLESHLGRRRLDEHLLETAFERGVGLDVLAVFVERRGADGLQLAPGEGRLEDVGRVEAPLRGACAHDGMDLVDEHDRVLRPAQPVEQLLHPLLELAAELRARHERRDVEREKRLSGDGVGHFAPRDAQRQPLDDGTLAHARLADQDGVVLLAARENLHHALDLPVASDDRVDAPFAGQPREVHAELVERMRGGALFGGAVFLVEVEAVHLDLRAEVAACGEFAQLLGDRLRRDAVHFQYARGGRCAVAGDGQQGVTRRDAPWSVRRGEQFGGEVAVELLGRAVVRLRLGGGDFALDAQTYLVKLPVAEPC